MNTHKLLDQHPSVQALNIATGGINPNKAAMHSQRINARPFTTASAVLAAHKGGRKDAKGTRLTVERNEDNIRAAAVAAQAARATSGGNFRVTATTKLAEKRGLPVAAPPVELPSVRPPPSENVKNLTRSKDETASLVSSRPSSFAANSSHADSYSDYSCSCCHPKKTPSTTVAVSSRAAMSKATGSVAPSAFSSTSVPLSAYENMTSISERIAKQQHGSGGAPRLPRSNAGASSLTGSMTSSKLKLLEDELAQERQHRIMTEKELKEIKARQELLLSRLTEEEREEVRKAAAAASSRK